MYKSSGRHAGSDATSPKTAFALSTMGRTTLKDDDPQMTKSCAGRNKLRTCATQSIIFWLCKSSISGSPTCSRAAGTGFKVAQKGFGSAACWSKTRLRPDLAGIRSPSKSAGWTSLSINCVKHRFPAYSRCCLSAWLCAKCLRQAKHCVPTDLNATEWARCSLGCKWYVQI